MCLMQYTDRNVLPLSVWVDNVPSCLLLVRVRASWTVFQLEGLQAAPRGPGMISPQEEAAV